jgi:hypothetical protein
MSQPARISALLGSAVILTLVAPFDTDTAMRPLPRLAYWLTLVLASYCAGFAASLLAARTAPQSLPRRIAIAAPLTGLAVFAIVYLLNGLALGYWPTGTRLIPLAAKVLAIAAIVSTMIQVALASSAPAPAVTPPTAMPGTAAAPQAPPALLDRLPLDKRGSLVSLSVEDHYVRIRTTKGEALVLMRLADAIRETDPAAGTRVHRSHWVCFDQVKSARRDGDRAILGMTKGPDIPVSRTHVPKIKEAGLLPR